MAASPGRELLILGLLRREPLSAYLLAKAVRGHAHMYRALREGNVYHDVALLSKDGFLRARMIEARRGPRAVKPQYALTAAGERRFIELLEAVLADVQAPDSTLEIAYVLLGQFSRAEAIRMLAMRRDAVGAHERRLRRLLGDFEQRGGSAYFAGSHAAARLLAEREWLRESIGRLRRSSWQPQWQRHDGPVDDESRLLT